MTTRPPHSFRALSRLLLASLALFLPACHIGPIKPVIVDKTQWGFGATGRATDIPDPDDLMPIEAGQYLYTDLDHPEAAPMILRIERVDSDPKSPWRRHTPDRRIEHLGYDSKGSLVMTAVEDLDHQALTTYSPPLPVIPAGLKPNRPRKYTSSMIVVNRANPAQQRDKGTCELTFTINDVQEVTAPAGRFRCYVITSEMTAKLGMATVTSNTDSWYAEDVGLIAEKTTEDIKAMFLHFGNKHTMLLSERNETLTTPGAGGLQPPGPAPGESTLKSP